MLEKIKTELQAKVNIHEELVKKYNDTKTQKEQLEAELLSIEKEIIHNQGAIEALDSFGYELMQEEAQTEPTPIEVEVIE